MTLDVLRRLVSVGTTLALGVSGLLAPKPGEALPVCPPGNGVSIDDFIMWDGTGGGPAPVPVRSLGACPYQRVVKYSTSMGTSSRRFRSGGISIGKTFRR